MDWGRRGGRETGGVISHDTAVSKGWVSSHVEKFELYSQDSGKFLNGFKQRATQLSESLLWLQCREWIGG